MKGLNIHPEGLLEMPLGIDEVEASHLFVG